MSDVKVMTVLGPVAPEEIGRTLMHEHVFADLRPFFTMPESSSLLADVDRPVDISLLTRLRRRPLGVTRDNLLLGDAETAVRELRQLVREGGSAVVDCTVHGLGRDAEALRRAARDTGLHIVQGTGVYVERSHPAWVEHSTSADLADLFVQELTRGIGDTGVRAGLIGEIGTSGFPPAPAFSAAEEKVLRGAARASLRTGAAVSVHLDPRGQGALAVIDVLEDEGVRPERMIMCHMDANADLAYHREVAERGAYLAYDHFGREYYAAHMSRPYPSDALRIEILLAMLETGFLGQIVLSHDVCMKIDLETYGGVGYAHLLRELVPVLRQKGITDGQIEAMLVDNPRRILAF